MATKTKTRKTSVTSSPKRFPRIVVPNLNNFEDRGWKIYDELRSKLEKKHLGKIVAIDVESKDYFVGDDIEDAGELAHAKHPGKLLFYTRIGGRIMEVAWS
jgi:hypothetical protein